MTVAPDAMARIARGEPVPTADLYFRTTPVFETGSETYARLNRVVAVASAPSPAADHSLTTRYDGGERGTGMVPAGRAGSA
jgi:hypothetical protein